MKVCICYIMLLILNHSLKKLAGEFGVVYKAILSFRGEYGQIVAVKTVKGL